MLASLVWQVVFPVPFAPGTPIVTAEEAPKSPASGSHWAPKLPHV